MSFEIFSEKQLASFEKYLLSHIKEESGTNLEKAMFYSLDAQGKRLRPLLLLAVLDSFGVDLQRGYPAAAALEMVHTYSLIHDDLPAMDNDDLRRGKATNHIKFDEATAILAGDALLTLAFAVLAAGELAPAIKIQLVQLLGQTAGYQGMVGGQQADIEGEEAHLSLGAIEAIHERKTGALIEMAMVAAGLIAEQEASVLTILKQIAMELGIAYQIRDDILDVVGSEKQLGKAVQTDSALGKSTYPALLGLAGSFAALDERLKKAKKGVQSIAEIDANFKTDLLMSFIDQLTLEEYQ